ncbi:MAG: glycosyltransferase family 2 protein [Lachnospiraceae bacterium]|jgi:teichuronic acid biosynthesis glycosyltransferase TuaG|nr:glycosyltransferase family 2 protein [Lachnospiraceae bacterium]
MKTVNETVSIIVPVYNAEKYIVETMEHVTAQTYRDWELLLVVDGCGDASAQVIREYQEARGDERLRLLVSQENIGAARARNKGLGEAVGRYIAYLDADDLWLPEKLEAQLAFMKEKQAAFVFTGYEFADEQGVGTGKVVHVPPRMEYRDALKNTTIFTSTVLFDTQRIPRDKLEMPAVKSEDTALWWKVLREGCTAWGLDRNLVLYRRPRQSLSSNKLEAVRRIWNLYRKEEKLSVPYSMYNFCFWAWRAVRRRI